MAIGPQIVVGPLTFEMLDIGKYRANTATAALPNDLSIDSSLNPSGESSFVVKRTLFVANPAIGGAPLKFQAHCVFRYPGIATAADLRALLDQLSTLASTANIGRMQRGER